MAIMTGSEEPHSLFYLKSVSPSLYSYTCPHSLDTTDSFKRYVEHVNVIPHTQPTFTPKFFTKSFKI
jgi:hypothetical protein